LAASLTTAHRGLTTLVIEAKNRPGGQPQFLYADKRIVDIPGFPDGITGEELSSRVYRQAKNALVQFRFNEELINIEDTEEEVKDDPLKKVITSKGGIPLSQSNSGCWLAPLSSQASGVGRVTVEESSLSDSQNRGL
jgi:thioredoxin reductase